jgi:hypothetical protein
MLAEVTTPSLQLAEPGQDVQIGIHDERNTVFATRANRRFSNHMEESSRTMKMTNEEWLRAAKRRLAAELHANRRKPAARGRLVTTSEVAAQLRAKGLEAEARAIELRAQGRRIVERSTRKLTS